MPDRLQECLRALIELCGVVFLNPGAAGRTLLEEEVAIGAVVDIEVATPEAQTVSGGGGSVSGESIDHRESK